MRLLLGIVLCAAACGGTTSSPDGGACDAGAYPCGPYGFTSGAVIADLSFQGRRDDDHDGTAANDPIRAMTLAEYHADPTVRALVLLIASETCVPCQNEQPMLLSLHTKYGAPVAFLEAIVLGQAGQPADTKTLDAWAGQFDVPFDMTADPTGVLHPYYDASAFPSTIVVRTSDMQIVSFTSGSANDLSPVLDPLTS